MQPVLGDGRAHDDQTAGGLVLLYAPAFKDIPPAFPFDGDTVVIGREPPAGGLRIPQDAVSRLHARATRQGDGWVLSDLGSRNGTLVNGRAIREVALQTFDEVRIGDAIFKFVDAGAEQYRPYRIDGALIDETGLEPHPALIGGLRIRTLAAEIVRVSPSELAVLVLGETGTGKELVAEAVHQASRRPGAFRALNCAAIPPTLLESELFGFKRGAFTGAHRDKPGLVQAAEKGTLLLDEIGELALESQAKLLRMIETREVTPLGSTTSLAMDVRLVCATHRDLPKMVEAGSFRSDLYARIRGYTVKLLPLRERKEDLYALSQHLLAKHGTPAHPITFPCMAALCRYNWPFNVRELEGALRRALAVASGAPIETRHLPEEVRAALEGYASVAPSSESRASFSAGAPPPGKSGPPSDAELRQLLARHHGNLAGVARELGKDRAQVHRWIKASGIDPNEYRVG
jgi:DNA-binding NtrC family response regulator